LKKWDLRRCEGEYHEQHTNQANYGKGKSWAFAWQPIIFECPPLKEKDK
jgi:hypothetical protein